jgi:sec-independent protein translocase protein TatA
MLTRVVCHHSTIRALKTGFRQPYNSPCSQLDESVKTTSPYNRQQLHGDETSRRNNTMGGIGVPELAIVLVIIVIIFGVGKLPEIGGALGKGIREFKTESTTEDGEDGKIEAGSSKTASTLTSTSTAPREEVKVGGSRADDI